MNLFVNKHQQKTEATKARLFTAARKAIAKHGFEAATIDQIASTAGFTRGAFYAHFKSKDDLFLAMLEHRAAQDFRAFQKQLQAVSGEARYEALWDLCRLRLRDTQWALLQLEFKLYIARRGSKGAKLSERFTNLRRSLREQYLKDLIPSKETRQSALFEAVTDGLCLQRAYKGAEFTEKEAEESMRLIFDFLLDQWQTSTSVRTSRSSSPAEQLGPE